MTTKKPVTSKAIFVSTEHHQKVRLIASLEAQKIGEWVEWAIDKGYESAMHNRGRKVLSDINKVKHEKETKKSKKSVAKSLS